MRDRLLLGVVRFSPGPTPDSYRLAAEGAHMSRSLWETGHLSLERPLPARSVFEVLQIDREAVDYEFILRCLKFCQRNHESCGRRPVKQMVAFRVIDCHTLMVLDAPPSCEYVALSYVWGQPTSSSFLFSTSIDELLDLRHVPKVISDSVCVTLKCGFRYLWVDRYCIDQSDEQTKHDQIGQMDLIYASARFTIIAAAGSGPHYGLPGVQGTMRKPQPRLKLDGVTLVSTLPFSSWPIRNSLWATRGWTYQEGLLSSRRIIFTDNQVYFECSDLSCSEAISYPLDHIDPLWRECSGSFKGNVPSFFSHHDRKMGSLYYYPRAPGETYWKAMSFISEFSLRKLSFPADSLNAMRGIFERFATARVPLYFFVGIPVMPPFVVRGNLHRTYSPARSASEGFLMGLSWYRYTPGIRKEFPSWSWAGWEGRVKSELLFDMEMQNRFSHIEVWLEDLNLHRVPFPDWDRLSQTILRFRDRCRFIHIQAPTFPLQVVYFTEEDLQGTTFGRGAFFAKLNINDHEHSYERVHLDFDVQNLHVCDDGHYDQWFPGVLISESGGGSENVIVLVVEEMGGYAERQGIFFYNCNPLSRKDGKLVRKPNFDWLRVLRVPRQIKLG